MIIKTLDQNLKIKVQPDEIDECFRANRRGEKPKDDTPILIKFMRYDTKQRIYTAKKNLKDSGSKVYINEDLPKEVADFHYRVRKLQKEGYIWKSWTANFSIYYTISKEDDEPKLISTDEDIRLIRAKVTARNTNA